ncbi:hypothetical protein EVAR_35972_1 [Eumeta japonica]|uniref:Uncharacterized protein n=1 Tax=Eumeta variegata TaxID=151549 RepID=A0A4C1W3Y1_EUMVA|nr:hypothetical protein EVAR_35972_1 [Eumeta japonica]
MHYDLLPPGKTINSDLYCQLLMRLNQKAEKKLPEISHRKGLARATRFNSATSAIRRRRRGTAPRVGGQLRTTPLRRVPPESRNIDPPGFHGTRLRSPGAARPRAGADKRAGSSADERRSSTRINCEQRKSLGSDPPMSLIASGPAPAVRAPHCRYPSGPSRYNGSRRGRDFGSVATGRTKRPRNADDGGNRSFRVWIHIYFV